MNWNLVLTSCGIAGALSFLVTFAVTLAITLDQPTCKEIIVDGCTNNEIIIVDDGVSHHASIPDSASEFEAILGRYRVRVEALGEKP